MPSATQQPGLPHPAPRFSTAELTVLLPVFNGAQHVAEAVESILAQTFTNFELLVINDGSTDNTLTILEQFAAQDARVRIVSRENRGLIASLNQGLALSSTDIIVRMDADDIALPHRLERQLAFMKAHPDVDVCGTGLVFFETGQEKRLPENHDALLVLTLFNTPVFHPTVIMRKSSVLTVGGYSSNAPCAEDYDLWERMLHSGSRFANLDEVLLRYRVHPNVNRSKYYVKMTATSLDICGRQLERLHLPVNAASLALHRICCAPCPETPAIHAQLIDWLHRIEKANAASPLYPKEALARELARREHAFTELSPFQQPAGWIARHLRHCAHRMLSLAGHNRPALEGWLASCWWHAKKFMKKLR
ncbi:MAG: hypothetical protein BCS36_00250 [Desulfovibrio sp. MES5]|nr:MAG: hypothetical protein BCS36_00250 [Desulfovibrio sp. MES5]